MGSNILLKPSNKQMKLKILIKVKEKSTENIDLITGLQNWFHALSNNEEKSNESYEI